MAQAFLKAQAQSCFVSYTKDVLIISSFMLSKAQMGLTFR